ncbi:translation initiation factor eIF-2B subunit delta [Candidatus Fervidibacteria bacterium JGI MDM2 SSWTFF-3-K9]
MDWQARLTKICSDRKSGAAVLTRKAVRLLAQMVRQGVKPTKLVEAAQKIADAHPAMAPLWHLSQLTSEFAQQPPKLLPSLKQFLADLETHTEAAISHAAEWLPEGRILTHSFSSLVFRAFVQANRKGKKLEVICTVSLPGGEGIALAKSLAKSKVPVMLVPDLQAFSWLMRCKVFLVGADAWCEDGLVHKVGTKHLAVVANQAGVPVWSVGTSEKRLPLGWDERMKGDAPPISRLPIAQDRTLYDLTEWSLVTGVIDENEVHCLEDGGV